MPVTVGGKTISGKTISAADPRFGMVGNVRSDVLWPGASNSAFNTPIGTSATLSAAGITFIELAHTRAELQRGCAVSVSGYSWTKPQRCKPSNLIAMAGAG